MTAATATQPSPVRGVVKSLSHSAPAAARPAREQVPSSRSAPGEPRGRRLARSIGAAPPRGHGTGRGVRVNGARNRRIAPPQPTNSRLGDWSGPARHDHSTGRLTGSSECGSRRRGDPGPERAGSLPHRPVQEGSSGSLRHAPTIVVRNGGLPRANLRRARLSLPELRAALRAQGIVSRAGLRDVVRPRAERTPERYPPGASRTLNGGLPAIPLARSDGQRVAVPPRVGPALEGARFRIAADALAPAHHPRPVVDHVDLVTPRC